MPYWSKIKRSWGRMVFRYAGRNISNRSVTHSRHFYNVIGRFYDWLYADLIYGYKSATQYLVDEFIQPGDTLLDVGCGTGLLIELSQSKADLAIGIDISVGMLQQARKKIGNQKSYLVAADCRALPLSTGFDKIISSFMLVILNREEQQKVIHTLTSHLNPGGALIFLTAQDDCSPEWLTSEEWRIYCSKAGFPHIDILDLYDFYRIVVASHNMKCERHNVSMQDMMVDMPGS